MKTPALIFLCAAVLPGLMAVFTSCGEKKKATVSRTDREPITPITVEVRPDGLAYLPGATTPFTGDAISAHPDMPWCVKMKEPYRDGKRDGDKLELFKDGKTKTRRRYDKGVPKYAATYHKNGQIKFELNLNAQDKGEGPYKRWFEDGKVESTASFDSEERWHGDMKEWDRAGTLIGHHVWEHGSLRKVILESEEMTKSRKEKGVEVQPAPVAGP
jgi:hypothetical protein